MGWGDVADEIVSVDVQQAVQGPAALLPAAAKPPTRGRRRGSGQVKEAFDRAAREIAQEREARLQLQVPLPASAASVRPSPADIQLLLACGNHLQRRLCHYVKQQMAKPCVPGERNQFDDVVASSQHVQSWTMKAIVANTSYKVAQQTDTRSAEALLQSSAILWSLTLQRLAAMIRDHGFEGLLLIRKRRYDESPFQLRLREEKKSTPPGATASEQSVGKAKVMQSELGFAALMRRPKPGTVDEYEYQEVHGWCPTWLRVLDKTTKENIAHSQRKMLRLVPMPDSIPDSFGLLCDMVCADAYSANLAAEKGLQSEAPQWCKSHNFCLLHKAAAVQTAQFRLVQGHVSGLLSLSLSMQASGTTAALREALSGILQDKLRVRYGDPAPEYIRHQDALHNLFLPVGPDTDAALLRKRQRS